MLELFGMALFVIVLAIIGFAWYIINYLLVKLPEQQKDILERYSLTAVNQTALHYSALDERQQKQIAEEKLRDIFQDVGIMLPSDTMIETSIGSAMHRAKQEKATLHLEQLRDQIIRAQVGAVETIAKLPATPNTALKSEKAIL